MKKEIRDEVEASILSSVKLAKSLDGEARARELKNVAILLDKLRDDYETEEGFLDKRHMMEFEKEMELSKINIEKSRIEIEEEKIEVEKRKIEVEKRKIDEEARSKAKLNVNTLVSVGTTFAAAALCMLYESSGHITPKFASGLLNKISGSVKS